MLEAIYQRRSVRKFLPDPISDETMTALLKAACAAPSAHHLRPWSFLVVTDQKKMQGMLEIHSHMEMLRTAPGGSGGLRRQWDLSGFLAGRLRRGYGKYCDRR